MLWFGGGLIVLGLVFGFLPFSVEMPLGLNGAEVSVSCSGPLISAWYSPGAYRPPGATASGGTVTTSQAEMQAMRQAFIDNAKASTCSEEARTRLWRPVGAMAAGGLAVGVVLVLTRRQTAALV